MYILGVKQLIDHLMKYPIAYVLVQNIVNGSGHKRIKEYLKKVIRSSELVLDQGCGTGEYSLLFKNYTGVDNNPKDIEYAQKKYVGKFMVGDAAKMDFKGFSFDSVFAVGLHHHLDEAQAKKAMTEALRVTKKGGKVVIIDAMLPVSPWNLVGLVLRKLDRGGFVRHFSKTLELLPQKTVVKYHIISTYPLDFICINITKQ